MAKYLALFKVNFIGLLSTFSTGSGKKGKRKISLAGAVALLVGVSLYISGIYSFMMADALSAVGLLHLVPVLMTGFGVVFTLMFTAMGAGGLLFGGKDTDFMFSLPLSWFSVLLSKVSALYAENAMLQVLFMVPAGVAVMVFGGNVGAGYLLLLFVAALLAGFFSTFLSLVIGFLLTALTSKTKGNALISNIVYMVFFLLVMGGSFWVSTFLSSMSMAADSVEQALSGWLLPLGWMEKGVMGDPVSLLLFALFCAVPFFLAVAVFSRFYKPLVTALSTQSMRKDFKMGSLSVGGQFSALFKKEAGRFFKTPIYFFNMGFSIILALGGSIFLCFKRGEIAVLQAQLGDYLPLGALAAAGLAFILFMLNTACVSVSLEGKYLWILKEAPISGKTLFFSKALLNGVLIWSTGIVCLPLLWYALALPIDQLLALLVMILGIGVFVPFFGLAMNLLFPKLDAVNDTVAIKQSMSGFLGIVGGMIIVFLLCGGYMLFGEMLGMSLYVAACGVLLCVAGLLFKLWVDRAGPRKLKEFS